MLPASADAFIWFGTGGLGVGAGIIIARQIGRGISWLLVFFTGRSDRKEAVVDAGMNLLLASLKEEVARLNADCSELRVWRMEDRMLLRDCERKHAESEAEVMKLKAMMQGYGDARQTAQLMMAADKSKDKPDG